jgi:hypothetical protein
MKKLLLLSFIISSFSLSAINRKFIRSIETIKVNYNKSNVWRGNTIRVSLDVLLDNGTIHNTMNSKEVDFNDFNISLLGDGKILKKKKRSLLIQLDKGISEKEVTLLATLRKNKFHSYTFKVPVKDYREDVTNIKLNNNQQYIFSGNTFQVGVTNYLKNGETNSTGHSKSKLYSSDYTYTITGCGALLSNNGKVKISNSNSLNNLKLTITATLKTNPKVTTSQTFTKHFKVNQRLNYHTFSATSASDARCVGELDGNDGRDGNDSYINGEDGEDGRGGLPGENGYRGEKGKNVKVYLTLTTIPNSSSQLLKAKVVCNNGQENIEYLDLEFGSLKIFIEGGDGGDGGDASDGGDGGDGGDGNTDYDKDNLNGYGGNAGYGSDGGFGGSGGAGGDGGDAVIFFNDATKQYLDKIIIVNTAGDGGYIGDGGDAGDGGDGGDGTEDGTEDGIDGKDGADGPDGRRGGLGRQGYI